MQSATYQYRCYSCPQIITRQTAHPGSPYLCVSCGNALEQACSNHFTKALRGY